MRLNQGPASQYYIHHVLGAGASLREIFRETRVQLMIFVERELQADERELIDKMLGAIAAPEYILQVEHIDEALLGKHEINFALSFGESKTSARPLKWVTLPTFDQLLGRGAHKENINAAKKTAWAQLKTLRQEMDLSCA